jgi:hypothetical protein
MNTLKSECKKENRRMRRRMAIAGLETCERTPAVLRDLSTKIANTNTDKEVTTTTTTIKSSRTLPKGMLGVSRSLLNGENAIKMAENKFTTD